MTETERKRDRGRHGQGGRKADRRKDRQGQTDRHRDRQTDREGGRDGMGISFFFLAFAVYTIKTAREMNDVVLSSSCLQP